MTARRAVTPTELGPLPLATRRNTIALCYLLGVCVTLACGIAAATAPFVSLALLGILLAPLMFRAGAWAWALAALGNVVCARVLSESGLLGPAVVFLDFPLCLAAVLTVVLRQPAYRSASRLGVGLLMLTFVAVLSGIRSAQSIAMTIFDIGVFIEPWLLTWALIVDPPPRGPKRVLVGALLAGALLQLPMAVGQVRMFGISDEVQGTFVGNGAGSHVVGAYAVLGALVAFGLAFRGRSRLWAPVGFLLLMVPVLSDAKQILFAFPVAVVALMLLSRDHLKGFRSAAIIAILFVATLYVSTMRSTHVAVSLIEQSGDSTSGTLGASSLIWHRMQATPASVLFGLGPGQTVSRVALLSSEGIVESDSPIARLGFQTAPLTAQIVSGLRDEPSSFNSGVSSALGLWGNFGILGFLSYCWLFVAAWVLLGRAQGDFAPAAQSVTLLMFVLGFVYSWWEQPPFTIPAAILIGVATMGQPQSNSDSSQPAG